MKKDILLLDISLFIVFHIICERNSYHTRYFLRLLNTVVVKWNLPSHADSQFCTIPVFYTVITDESSSTPFTWQNFSFNSFLQRLKDCTVYKVPQILLNLFPSIGSIYFYLGYSHWLHQHLGKLFRVI